MPDEFALFQSPKSPVQRAVSKVVVLFTWPGISGLIRSNGIEEGCVLKWTRLQGGEDVPSPFATHQVSSIVNTLQETLIIWR
ncbi:hypothetical protein [Streptomyces sp. NPDC047043]|uniref:hypothetical protein n=1 Tax=Streptomyces sp. NPDC047043 TaxID=3154497 RepID=UPI0033EA8DD2